MLMFKRNKTMHKTSLNLFRQKSPDSDHLSKRVFSSVRAGEKAPRHFSSAVKRAGAHALSNTLEDYQLCAGPGFAAKLSFISISFVTRKDRCQHQSNALRYRWGFSRLEQWSFSAVSSFLPREATKHRYVKCAGSETPFPSFHLLHGALNKVLLSETAGQKLLDSFCLFASSVQPIRWFWRTPIISGLKKWFSFFTRHCRVFFLWMIDEGAWDKRFQKYCQIGRRGIWHSVEENHERNAIKHFKVTKNIKKAKKNSWHIPLEGIL